MSREAANRLYRDGKIEDAKDAYTACVEAEKLRGGDGEELAKLYNNLSVCCKSLNQDVDALEHALACVSLEPTHAKAHLRAAVLQNGDNSSSGINLFAAAALLGSTDPVISQMLVSRNAPPVTLARTTPDLLRACFRSGVVVVLPGTYQLESQWICTPDKTNVRIIGLGKVIFVKGFEHAACCGEQAVLQIDNVQVIESVKHPGQAAFGVAAGEIILKNCRFINGVGGVTVTREGHAHIEQCEFYQMSNTGVEVNIGGTVDIVRSTFRECYRGVTACGGALRVHIMDCTFDYTEKKDKTALFFSGDKPPAAVRAIDKNVKPAKPSKHRAERDALALRHKTSEEAKAAAKAAGLTGRLTCRVARCHFSGCGFRAIECGDGAKVELISCMVQNARCDKEQGRMRIRQQLMQTPNVPPKDVEFLVRENEKRGIVNAIGLHIRGGAFVRASRCVFTENATAVNVDFNFDGDVLLDSCTFFRNDRDIEEATANNASASGLTMWTRPVRSIENLMPKSIAEVPTMKDLSSTVISEEVLAWSHTDKASLRIGASPARFPAFQLDPHYYPIGNTFGKDLLAGPAEPTSNSKTSRVILLACGDARNAVETVAGWWQRNSNSSGKLVLTLNDVCSSVLIRNAALLELMSQGVSQRILADVWGTAGLDATTYKALIDSLQSVTTAEWLNRDVADWDAVVEAWTQVTISADKMQEILSSRRAGMHSGALDLTCRAVGAEHREEVSSYLTGLLFAGGFPTRANPTFLEGSELRPTLYFSSSIFRSIGPLVTAQGSLADALFDRLGKLSKAVGAALHSGRVSVRLISGDAFDVVSTIKAVGDFELADVVDTTNVADYVGLANTLLLGAALGRRVNAQTMNFRVAVGGKHGATPESFYKASFGVDVASFCDLAGLRLVSGKVCSTGVFSTEWEHCAPARSAVRHSLSAVTVAKHMCSPCGYANGGTRSSTALTAAALLGSLRLELARLHPTAAEELRLLGGACVLHMTVEADIFLVRMHHNRALAVVLSEEPQVIGKVVRTVVAYLNLVRWNADEEAAVVLAPQDLQDRCGKLFASLALVDSDAICLSESTRVTDMRDLGAAPPFLLGRGVPVTDVAPCGGTWSLVGLKQTEAEPSSSKSDSLIEVDVTTPRVKGVTMRAVGQMVVFTAGQTSFEVDTGVQLGQCTRAACSATLGLASCAFGSKC